MLVISVLAEASFRSGRGGTIIVALPDVAGFALGLGDRTHSCQQMALFPGAKIQ